MITNEFGIQAFAQYDPSSDSIEIWIIMNKHDGRPDACRSLATALEKADIRPLESSKLEGLYEAQSKHLEDMRRLVFKEKKEEGEEE